LFWVISVYFNIRNTLPKSDTFLLGHSVYIYIFCPGIRVGCHTTCVAYFVLLPDGGHKATVQKVLFKPQVTVGFKFQILPRKAEF
jgi:hypothetical protein